MSTVSSNATGQTREKNTVRTLFPLWDSMFRFRYSILRSSSGILGGDDWRLQWHAELPFPQSPFVLSHTYSIKRFPLVFHYLILFLLGSRLSLDCLMRPSDRQGSHAPSDVQRFLFFLHVEYWQLFSLSSPDFLTCGPQSPMRQTVYGNSWISEGRTAVPPIEGL